MWRRFVAFTHKHKIVRGMISYGLLWPCGCLAEQTFIEKRTFRNYDWMKCLHFSLFGSLFMGPTVYGWIRLAGAMWPRSDIASAFCKSITEQLAYDPMAISTFLFCMSLMDGKTCKAARAEVSDKFLEAYKVGVIFWPCIQMVNYTMVPHRNQVVFISIFSMCWTTFLAYVKYLELPSVDVDYHSVDIHLLEM